MVEEAQIKNVSRDVNLVSKRACENLAPQNGLFLDRSNVQGRLANHFLTDPRPKFALSLSGTILDSNTAASQMINAGKLKQDVNGQIDYGASHLNASAKNIYSEIGSGRRQCKQMLKRLPDNEWLALHFFKVETEDNLEILLTAKYGALCPEDSLDAISRTFAFTVTESEVVRFMSKAYCPKEIGAEMNISVNTVRAHLRSIYSKTGVRSYNRALKLILELQA